MSNVKTVKRTISRADALEIDTLLGTDEIIVGDWETNGLYPSVIHCSVFKSYPSGNWFVFVQDENYSAKIHYLFSKVKYIAGHNFVSYDYPRVMCRLMASDVDFTKIIDTLILSRMFNFSRPGGHGLESWGEQLGVSKPKIEQWETYDEDMLHRCKQDVEINWRLFVKLWNEMGSDQMFGNASKIEHRAQYNMERMSEYGFWFNLPEAEALFADVYQEAERVKRILQKDFPPIPVPRNPKKPVSTTYLRKFREKALDENGNPIKEGRGFKWNEWTELVSRDKVAINSEHLVGDFCAIEWQEFNPKSPSQVKDKLDGCGWNPVNFNKPSANMIAAGIKNGSPKVSDEENLETIPDTAPQSIKNIGHYMIASGRVSRMNEWFAAVGEDQRVHGRILGIGAKTHRCAHREPNLGNVPAILNRKGEPAYKGAEYRGVWGVPQTQKEIDFYFDEGIYKTRDKRKLIGVDAEGIQLRVLAHHMNDPIYTEQVVDGDLHTYNMFAAGIDPGTPKIDPKTVLLKFGRELTLEELIEGRVDKKSGVEWSGRNVAKTFIYAFLLGAGNRKLLQITGIPGDILKQRFYEEIPSLKHLQEVEIPENVAKGYFIGIDGRKFSLDNVAPHKVLSIYLQAGEATIMKLALNILISNIDKYDYDAFPVAFVHDEFQIDSAEHCAEDVKKLAEDAIVQAGKWLKLNCPMAASGRIGDNWRMTH